LLDKDLDARLSQHLLIGVQLFLRRGAGRFRLLPCAFRQGVAFGENPLQRREKAPAEKKVKKENEENRRRSGQKQFAELVENFHRYFGYVGIRQRPAARLQRKTRGRPSLQAIPTLDKGVIL
jgi:hypothetical protein